MIRSKRTKARPGRLKGAALAELRRQCFLRDGFRCQHVVGYTLVHCRPHLCGKVVTWETGHMAHIVSRARGGKDELDNLVTKCAYCHLVREHSYGPNGIKPVPAKENP